MAKARPRKSRSGTMGVATRFSQARNPPSRIAPPRSVPRTSAPVQPASLARTSAQTTATTPAGEQGDAGEVDPVRCAVALGEQLRAEQYRDQADRDVQPEDPLPAEALRDHPSDEGTRGDGQSGQPAVDADDQAAALGRERRGQDGQAERHDGGRSEALHGPGRDEVREVRGQRAESRGDGEQQQPEVEDAAPPEPVTERRGRHDAGRERDAVGVDGPLQRGHRGLQVVLHVRQRADDDQGVEHYHEVGRRGQAQHPAEPIAAAWVRRHACIHRPCLHSSARVCGIWEW